MSKSYPRIHVIPAVGNDTAIVLVRKGKLTCTYEWDIQSNVITFGQCLKARIYEYRSDLSPNGKYFLYAAYENRASKDVRGMYAALSRSPYLKALDLYCDIEPRGGGGHFVGDLQYKLNEIFFAESKFKTRSSMLSCANKEDEHCLAGSVGVYLNRLLKLGWRNHGIEKSRTISNSIVLSKKYSQGLQLRKILYVGSNIDRKPSDWEQNDILSCDGAVVKSGEWEWAEILNHKLYFAKQGGLYAVELTSAGTISEPVIVNLFDGLRFTESIAPY